MPEPDESACTHRDGEKELPVRPCARCGTFVCERCQASQAPHCAPCRRLLNARLDARNKRTLYCIPSLVTPFGILFAVSRVDIGTGAPIQALLVPFVLGALPGLLAWFVLVKVLRRLELPTETSA